MSEFAAILLAAGSGTRMGQLTEVRSKALLPLNSQSAIKSTGLNESPWILELSLSLLLESKRFSEIIVLTRADERELVEERMCQQLAAIPHKVITGGETRQQSVSKGLAALSDSVTHIAVHDAARPCCLAKDVMRVCDLAVEEKAAALGVRVVQTLKRTSAAHQIIETVDRENVWEVQTPQVFERSLLVKAHEKATGVATDDCALVEQLGQPVFICEGRRSNIKITSEEDIAYAEFLLSRIS